MTAECDEYGYFYGYSARIPCPSVSSRVPWCHYVSRIDWRCGQDVVL